MNVPDLHIVTFGVPFPARYGGAIDVWNRIQALYKLGVKINLHCFLYGNFRPQPELQKVSEQVHYYPRVVWPALLSKGQPYIVTSRKSQPLLKRLSENHQPILFEGIHTTGFVPLLTERKLLLRSHNIEHEYYNELASQSTGVKSLLFRREALCLRDYESTTARSMDVVFAISPKDQLWFEARRANSLFLPPFHGSHHVDIQSGRGQYLLYQGDLSLEINQNALIDLMEKLPSDPIYPVVAAGRSGDKSFEEKLARFPNLRREADVSQEKMTQLIQQAQIILIHSLHLSGMKLKIFPALYHGRFIAASATSATQTGLDKAMHFYDQYSFNALLKQLWSTDFTQEDLTSRMEIVAQHPSDTDKAKEIIRYL
jgi:hypothetical protein